MTPDEFEQCRVRFGDDLETWPAPYRQEALGMRPVTQSLDETEALDRLVLDAVLLDTSDEKLTRAVLARIDTDSKPGLGSFLSGFLLRPAGTTACAALLLLALAVGGYQAAGLQGDPLESELLAFAAGNPVFNDGGPDGENAL